MHRETSYTFHGDAPIGGLLPVEADTLVLGRVMEQDRAREPASGGRMTPARQQQRQQLMQEVADANPA